MTTLPIIVTVTQSDIDNAGTGALCCPIATCIYRALGLVVSVIEAGGVYTLDERGCHQIPLRNPTSKLVDGIDCPDLDDPVCYFISVYDHEGREAVSPGLQVELDVPADMIQVLDLVDMEELA